jgi:hypothetical protein
LEAITRFCRVIYPLYHNPSAQREREAGRLGER